MTKRRKATPKMKRDFEKACRALQKKRESVEARERAQAADVVDGFNRDDLGESPDV